MPPALLKQFNRQQRIWIEAVPGGGVDKRRRQWKKKKGEFLFKHDLMAKVFRARFLAALNEAGLSIPKSVPPKWVVDCSHVEKSRRMYRLYKLQQGS